MKINRHFVCQAVIMVLGLVFSLTVFAHDNRYGHYHGYDNTVYFDSFIRRTDPPFYGRGMGYSYNSYNPALTGPRAEPGLITRAVRVTLNDNTHFDFDRSRLKPAGRAVLDDVINRMAGLDPGYGMGRYGFVRGIELVGHTDSIGSHRYNDRLGKRRAIAVRKYLQSRGIKKAAVTTHSEGERAPIASNNSDRGRAANRRTEVIVHVTAVPDWY